MYFKEKRLSILKKIGYTYSIGNIFKRKLSGQIGHVFNVGEKYMREKYESLPLAELKAVAKARGIKGLSTMKKDDVVEAMLREDEREKQEREAKESALSPEIAQLDSGITVTGILEVMTDGFGFIRSANYLPGENDIYVAPAQIRRFGLKTGDIITGNTKVKSEKEKFSALLYLTAINGLRPSEAAKRKNFEDMTPIFPNERIYLERKGGSVAMRIVDEISPDWEGPARYDRISAKSRENNTVKGYCEINYNQ